MSKIVFYTRNLPTQPFSPLREEVVIQFLVKDTRSSESEEKPSLKLEIFTKEFESDKK